MEFASLLGIALWALLPGFIAKKKGRSVVRIILFEIRSYRKKYDASFLKNVLKK